MIQRRFFDGMDRGAGAAAGAVSVVAPETVPAFTAQQPWAYAIVNLDKRIENRPLPYPWKDYVGRTVFVHAGMSKQWDTPDARRLIERSGAEVPHWQALPKGVLVGLCRIVAVRPLNHPTSLAPGPARFAAGPYCLDLGRVIRLDRPIECRGQQGMFSVPWEALTREAQGYYLDLEAERANPVDAIQAGGA